MKFMCQSRIVCTAVKLPSTCTNTAVVQMHERPIFVSLLHFCVYVSFCSGYLFLLQLFLHICVSGVRMYLYVIINSWLRKPRRVSLCWTEGGIALQTDMSTQIDSQLLIPSNLFCVSVFLLLYAFFFFTFSLLKKIERSAIWWGITEVFKPLMILMEM